MFVGHHARIIEVLGDVSIRVSFFFFSLNPQLRKAISDGWASDCCQLLKIHIMQNRVWFKDKCCHIVQVNDTFASEIDTEYKMKCHNFYL